MIASNSILGVGLYSPSEAARYMRASPQRLSRWIYGTSNSDPVFKPELDTLNDERVVTFLDFAQALSIQDIRLNIGIPLQQIREAYRRAQKEYDIDFPFAVENGIFVFGEIQVPKLCVLGIYIPAGERDSREDCAKRMAVQLTGRHNRNIMIHEIVKDFSRRLHFSTSSGVVDQYECYKNDDHRIVMDPQVRFGSPYLEEVGYRAETLFDAARIEGGVERAAKIYDVPVSAVQTAVAYMRELKTPPQPIRPKTLRDKHKA